MAEDPSEHTRALELTAPRDTLPEDPSGSIAFPEFAVVRRGYDRVAVDAYVQRVVKLVDELDTVRSPKAAVRQALERVGEETTGILAQAHQAADEVTSKSRREAEERLAHVRAEAEELVRSAQERAQALDRDADVIWQERVRLLGDVERVAGELQRVVRGAEERFPPETEAETVDEAPTIETDKEATPP